MGSQARNPLKQLIVERIRREGPIPFSEYMRMALYEPGHGYYVSGEAKTGWEGDYFTSTDVSTFFANCMGRQFYAMWEKLKKPVPFVVVEEGAGRGHLAHGVRAWAEREAPDFHKVLDYRVEDIRVGQDVLSEAADAGESAPSVILSNELIDAFPVHVVEVRDGQLYEVYVDEQNGRLCEVLSEPETPEVAAYLDTYKIPWRTYGDGWRAEINLDALRWVERVARRVRKGFILTVDYGEKARDLYTPQRRLGTLNCYYQHQMTGWPLARPGAQDITAHVNFSALIQEARRHGLRVSKFTTQREWLEGLGIREELELLRQQEFAEADTARASDRGQVALLKWYNVRQGVLLLTDPYGMGNFKVLILRH
ncbi:MAG TPA: SAM-dependent methyltransferase [Ktedonobacteraceae bacterium]|jgi:SAM-dependent MidA family methyltransferase|nr:SAM-dependent methyltransferase [Ktedonobacteraceae bacterium]